MHLFVFDLLQLGGRSLLGLPYRQRRDILIDLALPGEHPIEVPPGWHDQDPEELLKVAAAYKLEGICGVQHRAFGRGQPVGPDCSGR